MKSSAAHRLTFAVIAITLSALVAACGGSDSTTAPTPPPKGTIQVLDDHYNPSSLTVTMGDSVTWVWGGSHDHSVTEGTPGGAVHAFDSGIKTTGKFGHRFNTAGTVHYFCLIHGSAMTGKITVNP